MEEDKKIKISLSTFFLIIAIIVIIIMSFFIYTILNENKIAKTETNTLKDKVNNLESKLSGMKVPENKEENEVTINKTSESIPTEDLFAIDYNIINGMETINPCLAKISNGDLYYLDTKKIDTIKYYSPCEEYYVKVDSDVKRIKSLTLGTDTSIQYLVIKTDGTVKLLGIETSKIQYEIYNELKDYKIDDITNFDGDTFTLKLLDGTTKTVKHFAGGAE